MIEVNREGKLTRGQKIYLLRQFLERLGFMLLWLLSIFFVENALRYGVGGITTFYWLLLTGFKSLGIMALIGYTAIYALDLFWTKPIKTKGILSKVQKRVGHSDQYWVEVGRNKTLTTELIWLSLQPGRCTNCSMQDGQNSSCRMSSCLQNEVIAAKSYFLLSQSERIFLFVD